ncbi:major facilitator superfamily domain-containing protein [Schizophyllum commune]
MTRGLSKGSTSEVQVEYEEVVLPVLRSPRTKFPAFSLRPPEAFEYYESPPSPSPPPRSPSVRLSIQSTQEVRTGKQVREGYLQLFAGFWSMILLGWNDGTTGPLLPRIQTVYDVNYTIVSLLFVSACTGFVAGAIINVPLSTRLGFGRVRARSALQVIAYAVDATAPPFPVLCVAYAVNGAGMSLQDAQTNGYVASLTENQEAKMGMLHAAYGLGALLAPLVSTQFAQMHRWSFHYLTSMGVALANMAISAAVFRFENQDQCIARIGQPPKEESQRTNSDNNTGSESNINPGNSLLQLFRLKSMHLLALFAFVYVGVEVTLGGWIVSYVIDKRGGGPDSGYISSGFFAGMMLGRLVLLWVNKKIGEWPVIFVYGLLAIGLELIVWLVPSLLGGAISVALVGLLLGPFFPIAMNQAARILPGFLLTPSIGWIAGIGQAGSAVLPFLTGALAQGAGIGSLQPFLVSMMAFMMVLWAMVPRKAQRMD